MQRLFTLALIFISSTTLALAAGSVTVDVAGADPGSFTVGDVITYEVNVTGAKVKGDVKLPNVSGLALTGSGTNFVSGPEIFSFFLTPSRPGDYTIPTFEIRTTDGETLHVPAFKLHVNPASQ